MKKILSIVLSAMLLVVMAFTLTACGSVKGKEFVYSEVKVKWADDITKLEKELAIENGDYADEDELFDDIIKMFNEDYEGIGFKFSDDGKTAFRTVDGESDDNGYDVEKANGYIFLTREIAEVKRVSVKLKSSFGKLVQEGQYGDFWVKVIYKKA